MLGADLRCCVLIEAPFTVRDAAAGVTGGFGGSTLDYYVRLRDETGVTCSTFTEYPGFTRLIEHFADCSSGGDSAACDCDMALGAITRNEAREGLVDFVAPIVFDSLSVVQRRSELGAVSAGVFFLAPFDWRVWLGIVGLLFLHVFVTLFDRNFSPPSSEDAPPQDLRGPHRLMHMLLKTKLLRRIRYAFFATSFGMVGHVNDTADSEIRTRPTTRQRLLSLLAVLFGTFVLLVYESGLVLQLFLDEPVSDFRSIEDLKSCRVDANKVCVPGGGNTQAYFEDAIDVARNSCRSGSFANDRAVFVPAAGGRDAYTNGLNRVAKDGDACIYFMASTVTVTTATQTTYCGRLSVVGESFYPNALGLVLPRGSNLTDPLSKATLMLHRKDRIADPIEATVKSPCKLTLERQLTWTQLGIFFYVAFAALGLMFFCMCWGTMVKRAHRARVRENNGVSTVGGGSESGGAGTGAENEEAGLEKERGTDIVANGGKSVEEVDSEMALSCDDALVNVGSAMSDGSSFRNMPSKSE